MRLLFALFISFSCQAQIAMQSPMYFKANYGMHPEFIDIINYAESQSYTIPTLRAALRLNDKYSKLKNTGILAEMGFYYSCQSAQAGTATENFAKLNWVNPSSNEITVHGTVTYDGLEGWTPNGTNGYLRTHWTPAAPMTQNDASFGLFIGSNTAVNSTSDIGASNNANGVENGIFLSTRSATGILQSRINDNTSTSISGQGNSIGMHHVSRTASNARKLSKTGLTMVADATASTSLTTAEVYLGASNGNGTATRFANRTIRSGWAGGALTNKQVYNLHAINYDFQRHTSTPPAFGASFALLADNLFTWSSGKQPRDPSNIIKFGDYYYFYAGLQTQDIGFDNYDSDEIHAFRADNWYGPYTDVATIWAARPGEWDDGIVYTPNAVVEDGTVYVFYTGEDKIGVSTQGGNIGMIYSTDPEGSFAEVQSGPILGNFDDGLDAGALAAYEDFRLDAACPLKMADGSWRLYYKSVHDTGSTKEKYFNYATTSGASFPTGWTRASSTPFYSDANTSGGDQPESPTIYYDKGDNLYYMIMHENSYSEFRMFSSADGVTSWTLLRAVTNTNVEGTEINGYAVYVDDAGVLRGILYHDGPTSSNPTTDVRFIKGLGRVDVVD